MITLFCSAKKQKLPFIPIRQNAIRIYLCGPTVYDDAHLGHARSSIVFDLWRRLFMFLDYEVLFAKNFTDIDDKIIKKAFSQNKSVEDITTYYIQRYLQDMDALGVLRADIAPKATENLAPICEMIENLLRKDYAYKGENNDIYLSIHKDSQYGSISMRDESTREKDSQSRIDNATDKLEHYDFALWKGDKGENDISYESPFGRGRPGWHIECSAMIEKHIAYENEPYGIDIHAGGADLLFPHHENEASQTRCATGREIAKYWLHNGFVNINGEKMSKSLGNSFFVKDALKVYDGEILRNYLLGVHYRLVLNFNEEDLLQSKKRLDKLYRLKKRVKDINISYFLESDSQTSHLPKINLKEAKKQANESFLNALIGALSEDYNISKALSVIEEMIATSNENLDKNPKDNAQKVHIAANLACVEFLLGLGGKDSSVYFQLGVSKEQKQYIESQLALRAKAKAEKDYALADKIRNDLKEQGIEVMDSPQGSVWEKI